MSNDLKYVLLPTIEDRRRSPKFQPWYRERLRMKYPCNINTRNWKFVKDGLDDFRDGLPPPHDDLIIEPDKGPGPVVIAEKRRIKETASNVHQRLQEHQIYFSRELPAAEKRRKTIENYITTLLEHPLAFFSHFNQVLPPETYERVTKLLEAELLRATNEDQHSSSDEQRDPFSVAPSTNTTRPQTSNSDKTFSELLAGHDEKATSNPATDFPTAEPVQTSEQIFEDLESKSSSTRPGRSGIVYDEAGNQWDAKEYERKQKNPYRWFIEKQREKQKAKGPSQDEQAASAMEARLRTVAEQFCSWLYDLGGENNVDIDPAVVRNLFSTAYDTKPSLSVPIKIVEMTRIPAELREGAQDSMIPQEEGVPATLSSLGTAPPAGKARDLTSTAQDRSAGPKKYRYGAWYLPKELWQRSLVTEELRDPKVIKAEREDATRKREEEINARLAPLHGVNAFKDFLMEKNARRLPKLITDVEQYRRDHPREATTVTATDQLSKRPVT